MTLRKRSRPFNGSFPGDLPNTALTGLTFLHKCGRLPFSASDIEFCFICRRQFVGCGSNPCHEDRYNSTSFEESPFCWSFAGTPSCIPLTPAGWVRSHSIQNDLVGRA